MNENHEREKARKAADRAFRRERKRQLKRLPRLRRETYAAIRDLLSDASDRIRRRLADQPTDYELWILPQLQNEIRQTLTRVGEQAAQAGLSGFDASVAAGVDLIDQPLKAGGLYVQAAAPRISNQQLLAMRDFMTDRIRDITVQATNQINTSLGLSVIGAQPVSAAVSDVQKILKTKSRRRALTIVHTELGRAYATAGQQRMDEVSVEVPQLKKQWRRSGKIHSRIAHDAADGQIRAVDEPFRINGHDLMYPHDPKAPASETINCGCVSLPYIGDWDIQHPGRKPFSSQEKAANRFKRDLDQSLKQQ